MAKLGLFVGDIRLPQIIDVFYKRYFFLQNNAQDSPDRPSPGVNPISYFGLNYIKIDVNHEEFQLQFIPNSCIGLTPAQYMCLPPKNEL